MKGMIKMAQKGTNKQKENKKSVLNIPFERNQNNAEVDIRKWFGQNGDNRFDLVFKTENSYISHSLSEQQFNLLKQKIKEFG